MPKQKRKSISIKGSTYERMRLYVERHGGGTISGIIDGWISEKIGPPINNTPLDSPAHINAPAVMRAEDVPSMPPPGHKS